MHIAMTPEAVAGRAGRFGAGLDDGVTGRWGSGGAIASAVDAAVDDGQVWHVAAWAALRQGRDDVARMARDAAACLSAGDVEVRAAMNAAADGFVVGL